MRSFPHKMSMLIRASAAQELKYYATNPRGQRQELNIADREAVVRLSANNMPSNDVPEKVGNLLARFYGLVNRRRYALSLHLINLAPSIAFPSPHPYLHTPSTFSDGSHPPFHLSRHCIRPRTHSGRRRARIPNRGCERSGDARR